MRRINEICLEKAVNIFLRGICFAPFRYKLENGSLYFENVEHSYAHRPDEGMYQCKATVRTQGTIVSRKARLQVACKYLSKSFVIIY